MYLTKSDFKAARECPTKLYYRKAKYPSALSDDEYLQFLADGGYMIEEVARAKFLDGREMPLSMDEGAEATWQEMAEENAVLFEASFKAGQLFARVDILEKRGKVIRLVEVKAKSFEPVDGQSVFRGKRGDISAVWIPYLEDVTFQTLVLRRLYPAFTVIPCLCLVDKSAECSEDHLFKLFEFVITGEKSRPTVLFRGDRQSLGKSALVRFIDVSEEVDELLPEVERVSDELCRSLDPLQRIPPKLGAKCKGCEYRFSYGATPKENGFAECWGNMADHEHHILDLYRIDLLENTGHVQKLIDGGNASLLDVRPTMLTGGSRDRQLRQLKHTNTGNEYISPKLPKLLKNCRYPLHFVDFEASRLAVPYHAGMRPYEQVLFQWSCHTITKPNVSLTHREWINTEESYPNFEFCRSLKDVLEPCGTVFVWSHFERSALRDVRQQLQQYGSKEMELAEWLDGMIAEEGPIVDLCQLSRDHYFHPRMKGSHSIKYVLPAVWEASETLRNHPWFADYQLFKDGRQLTPYEALPALPFGDREEIEVREGTGAMRTYQDMLYGRGRTDPGYRDGQKQALLNYCKLDTAAMVMIWMRWTARA